MSAPSALLPLLACPRCDHTPLDEGKGGYRCEGCHNEFPLIGGIPWLFAEPAVALDEWRSRLNFSLKTLAHEHSQLEHAAKAAKNRELTRRRLTMIADAKLAYARQLENLLAPLELSSLITNYESSLAFRQRIPSSQSLTTYAYNVHRDWAWGDKENEASFGLVGDALHGASPGKMLVLGAGAGRLAYDLHMRSPSTATVVLDFNPFLLLLAQQITSGQAVDLYEFPYAPKTLDDHVVLNTLAAKEPCRAGLEYILGDAHRPPFAQASFDTIVTPWLIDILPEDFDALSKRINYLLAEGGRWINFGSLHFHVVDEALRYSKEECKEIIAASGFDSARFNETTIPYLCSPASRHGRLEQVLVWSAVKSGEVGEVPRRHALPDWLIEGDDSVPQLDVFQSQAVATRLRAFILSLIDGRRSLNDMADAFEQQKIMPHSEAKASIRAFLIKLYESSQRS